MRQNGRSTVLMARATVALPRTFWFSLCLLASSVMAELYIILRP
jgi:hypothetical protein